MKKQMEKAEKKKREKRKLAEKESKQIVCDKWLIMLPGSKRGNWGLRTWDFGLTAAGIYRGLPLAVWWHDEHVACPKAPSHSPRLPVCPHASMLLMRALPK